MHVEYVRVHGEITKLSLYPMCTEQHVADGCAPCDCVCTVHRNSTAITCVYSHGGIAIERWLCTVRAHREYHHACYIVYCIYLQMVTLGHFIFR